MAKKVSRGEASDLIRKALEGSREKPASSRPEESGPEPSEPLELLVETYLELENPAERDAVFELLCEHQGDQVTDFLRTIARGDPDDYLKRAAIAELARRGDPASIAFLEQELNQRTNADAYSDALYVLAEIKGSELSDRLIGLIRSPQLDESLLRVTLLTLEYVDSALAVQTVKHLVDSSDVQDVRFDSLLETAIATLVRQDDPKAVPWLQKVKSRIEAASFDVFDRDERLEIAQEGIQLLSTSAPPRQTDPSD